ncbi:MAG: dethiobiotin synthase [Nitrospiraceae bacterium]|nr:dethiobiotin synthase [Nitrospiraceae bacterium]
MGHGLFITGTDTGVGKTAVACALATKLRAQGHDVGVMKPVLTGANVHPNDTDRLMLAAKVSDPRHLVSPYQFNHTLAPQIAAERDKVPIDIQNIKTAFDALHAQHDILLVEGIGGIMVPITKEFYVLDLITLLGLSVLVVARGNIGTINHSVMTIKLLQIHKIPVAGLVLNYPNTTPVHSPQDLGWPRILRSTGVNSRGILKHISNLEESWDEGIVYLSQQLLTDDLFSVHTQSE